MFETIGNLDNDKNAKMLNFRVSPGLHQEFKMFAVQKGISMQDLFLKGFELIKKAL